MCVSILAVFFNWLCWNQTSIVWGRGIIFAVDKLGIQYNFSSDVRRWSSGITKLVIIWNTKSGYDKIKISYLVWSYDPIVFKCLFFFF